MNFSSARRFDRASPRRGTHGNDSDGAGILSIVVEEALLLAAIAADPTDDQPRLVYAD
jgi:hypothetical protein